MKLTYTPYRSVFTRPIRVGRYTLRTRSGLFLFLHSSKNHLLAIAECAPLPGLSQDTLADVIQELAVTKPQETILDPQYYQSPLLQHAIGWLRFKQTHHQNTPIHCHDFCIDTRSLPQLTQQTRIKIKIARHALATEQADLMSFIARHPHCKLRLDANGLLDKATARHLLRTLPPDAIEYIEDPCPDPLESIEVTQESGHALAVDCPSLSLGHKEAYGYVILKPTCLGDLTALKTIQQAFSHSRCILSSTYESPVGLSMLVDYAQVLAPQLHHGINTSGVFPNKTPYTKRHTLNALSVADCLDVVSQWTT